MSETAKLSSNLKEAQAQLNVAYQAAIKELKAEQRLDQVIDELVTDYRPNGDLFYSDISRRLKDRLGKKYPAEAFSRVCDALRGAGLKIWGD